MAMEARSCTSYCILLLATSMSVADYETNIGHVSLIIQRPGDFYAYILYSLLCSTYVEQV